MVPTEDAIQLDDPRADAEAIVSDASGEGLTLRVTGGVAVNIRCETSTLPALRRRYKDVDLIGLRSERTELDAFMKARGLIANEEFNSLHGQHQMFYADQNGRVLDIFMDQIVMCHSLNVSKRLNLHEVTLTLEDLLLSKLQVYETNESDVKDAIAILATEQLDEKRIADVLGEDWGWWRTATEVLGKVADYNDALEEFPHKASVSERIEHLQRVIEEKPKGLKWRMRARVGDRVAWYHTPEEELQD